MNSSATFFVSDERMLLHKNEWDKTHIEIPERLESILNILKANQILDKCTVLESQKAAIEDICLIHTKEYVEEIRKTQNTSLKDLEAYCATKEDVYANEHTWESSLLAAGSSVHLLQTVLANPGSNGFGAVRPPGHHAWSDTPCGFCIFNNIAICAKKARQLGVERVLIFDWDIHAAQGTQYCIEDDTGIRLVSIHRFEDGTFWPELPESGVKQPYKQTINIPLNELGYSDSEYAAIFNFFVLPIIKDWKPQLILVSNGYDAAIGDPQGEMAVSPGIYGYMAGALASLRIPLVLLLEGGYFIESVAQGALYTMNALIERKHPQINLDIFKPSKTFLKFLISIISSHSADYPTLNVWSSFVNNLRQTKGLPPISEPKIKYKGHRELITFPQQTRDIYVPITEEENKKYCDVIQSFFVQYKLPIRKKSRLSIFLDKYGKLRFETIAIQLASGATGVAQLNAFYFYILIPLSLTYKIDFVVTFNKLNYTLNNGLFDVIISDFEEIVDAAKEKNDEDFQKGLEHIFYNFETLKNYFPILE